MLWRGSERLLAETCCCCWRQGFRSQEFLRKKFIGAYVAWRNEEGKAEAEDGREKLKQLQHFIWGDLETERGFVSGCWV